MDIYMDNAATTAVSEAALGAMLPALTTAYGNPSSLYSRGQEASRLVEEARQTVARALHAKPQEIYFTSGGSEADNWGHHADGCARCEARQAAHHLDDV